jgi:cellulose synthase (UDP-forming)
LGIKPVLAAQVMDWPVEKIKIYLLDDGHREEFRSFANEAGVRYIAREDHIYAKAGNINNALKQATGEYVVIFEHILYAFLTSPGWFPKFNQAGSNPSFLLRLTLSVLRRKILMIVHGLVQDLHDL